MKNCTPEEVGLSSAGVRRISRAMQRYVDEKKTAGMIPVLARRGRVAYAECLGLMDIEANKPMRFDTLFRIASMTKPITSVAVMMLYEEGKLRLEDPVSRFIPEFEDTEVFVRMTDDGMETTEQSPEMMIKHLLTHTSGLSYGWDQDSPVEALYREAKIVGGGWKTPPGEWIKKLARLPLLQQPGSAWRYSVSIDVLGCLIPVASGMSFDAFLKARVLEPLGMVDTAFYVPKDKIGRLATLYNATDNGLEVYQKRPMRQFDKPPAFCSGGGGLVSTAPDYMRFAQMLLNGGKLDGVRLLKRETVDFMTRNHLSDALLQLRNAPDLLHGRGFGLGVGVRMAVDPSDRLGSVGGYGWGGAFLTHVWIDPQEELIGLIMQQLLDEGDKRPAPEFRRLVYQALLD